jgi:phosphoribosylamine--glycine ligase
MKILVIGNGGREHAIISKLLESKKKPEIYCVPGIEAIENDVINVRLNILDNETLKNLVVSEKIDFTVVGPEAPLVNGIVDYFENSGLKIFGPSKAAAQLEGSKAFSKAIMKKYEIPTASYQKFNNYDTAKEYIESNETYPIVIKASGLAAGKGVVIPESKEDALRELKEMMLDHKFGSAADEIIIESFLEGEEASVFAICDGKNFLTLSPAQDHKRIGEGDTGKNTGGMGAYAPAPIVTETVLERTKDQVIRPLLEGMRADGIPYKGVLYVGLMIKNEKPSVVEFNARFGDPETQIVLPLLDEDLIDIFLASIDERIGERKAKTKQQSAMTVVMASGGYPDSYEKGYKISGLYKLEETTVYHAGTRVDDGKIVTNGGRVLNVLAIKDSLKECAHTIYNEIKHISFEKAYYRKDIGHRVLNH